MKWKKESVGREYIEYIEKENVLHFDINTSKITLKVHYTLVEDITR